jgi:hypothetical protein
MKCWMVLVAFALIGAGTAHAGKPIQSPLITVKVADPVFLGPTPGCAALRAHTDLVSEGGEVIGSSMFCIASAPYDDATSTLTETGTLEIHLPGGEIVTQATIVDDLGVYPVVQTIFGTVISGGGHYQGASGTLSGGGTIEFDESGNPIPDSTLVIDLS